MRLHLEPAPRPSQPVPPLAAPLGAPHAPFWPRRQLPGQPSIRGTRGKPGARVTSDLPCTPPYRLCNHLTVCPRARGSIPREPAPRQPTPYTPRDWPTGPQLHLPIGWILRITLGCRRARRADGKFRGSALPRSRWRRGHGGPGGSCLLQS